MNSRRKLIVAVGVGAIMVPIGAMAQKKPAKAYRIGMLFLTNPVAAAHLNQAFIEGLREHGYVEGQNLIVERRYSENKADRFSEFAAELVRIKVDAILTATDLGIAAVKQQTQTIPIVMVNSADPVGAGFVAGLSHPGGNITGLSTMSPELSGKRLELLREVVPTIARVGIMWNPDVRSTKFDYNETEVAARTLRLELQSVEVRRAEDLDRAFSALAKGRAEGLIVPTPNPILFANRAQIVGLAAQNRLPTMYGQVEFVDAGGLMSYGTNNAAQWRRAAFFISRILKGAKPADLPVEQPTRFELAVNMKTAKALGLTIPPTVMVRADRVIQ